MPGCWPLTILQVEDTLSDAQMTAYALEAGEISHSMYVVTDGSQAMDFLKRRGQYRDAPRPDLILLDLELPMLSGNDVLEFIKSDDHFKAIPVIIFSTRDTAESKAHAYELHANSYVVKPTDMATFVKRVQSIADYWCNTSEVVRAMN